MTTETGQRPGKEAAGSRPEPGVGCQAATAATEAIGPPTEALMEQILDRDNLRNALKRVQANKGAPGVDGMAVDELPDYLREHWPAIREQLLHMTYMPSPVREVYVPKPGGGKRMLGIPTVRDRFITQAVLQVMGSIFEPGFSEHSYGFRPGRSAHQAVLQACSDMTEGYRGVVDIDLEKFFDHASCYSCR